MKIHSNSTLLMTGDSITDCGRVRPVGEAVGGDLGNGYAGLIAALIGATCPKRHIRIRNTGISGNTVRDLATRWQSDVLDLKPDWLSIMIGINDVWRQFDAPERHVSLAEYASILEQLVRTTRPQLKGLVLMTPYFIEPGGPHAGNDGPVWGGGAPAGRAIPSHLGRYSGGVRLCLAGGSSDGTGFGPGASGLGGAHGSSAGFFEGAGVPLVNPGQKRRRCHENVYLRTGQNPPFRLYLGCSYRHTPARPALPDTSPASLAAGLPRLSAES